MRRINLTIFSTLQKLLHKNLYLFLLPFFFVFHGYVENYGLITISNCLVLLGAYFIAFTVLYFFLYLCYQNISKAALLSGVLMSLYFFFGATHDFLKLQLTFLSSYKILLPVLFISSLCFAVYLKQTNRNFFKAIFFINSLLLVYLVWDLTLFGWKLVNPNPDKLSTYGFSQNNRYLPCADCPNPTIYFLLMDEYSSSESLRQNFNYNNSSLDSFLLQKGFSIQSNSYANYNFTPFSMASILNMNYIKGIKDVAACTVEDYADCNNLIRNNEVIRFLSSRQYDIVNYSVFDLAGNPSFVEQSLLPVKTRLITEQTFFHRFMRDVGWHFYSGPVEIKWLTKDRLNWSLNVNNQFVEKVKKESKISTSRPRFVYVHFTMPHPPFYYNKNNRIRSEKELAAEETGDHVESYTDYLPYTNGKIKELIGAIQKNTDNTAVIILMGDHGYRANLNIASKNHYFKNLNAIYFPDKNYSLLKDSISGVNQFRLIFNSLFKQSFPLLKDSSIFLTDIK